MHLTSLLEPKPFSAMVMGNHALARAMIESGAKVITTYPGSPTPEIATALCRIPRAERPFYFEYSANEKVALEIACGAAMNGHLSSVFFKSVGLNVAMDSMIQLPLFELIGGMVIVIGDDPGAHSSQNEQDNRHFARMAHMPMLEPATPKEAYEMFLSAAALSKEMHAPVCLRTTTHVAHARQQVRFGPLPDDLPDWTSRFDTRNGPYWPIAAKVFPLKQRSLEKERTFRRRADESGLNPLFAAEGAPVRRGIIAAGLPALSALENIGDGNAPVDLLKLGVTHPVPEETILGFLRAHETVLVLEELDRILEKEIKLLAYERKLSCAISARPNLADEMGELTSDRTAAILHVAWPDIFSAPASVNAGALGATPRLPQLCPGCGHRSAFFAIKKALRDTDITVGDIGCHTLGALPPYELGEIVLSMGHSVSTGTGLAIGNPDRKVVAFLGDGTLFHAALPGIINAAVNDHDLTLVILENGTTAMTGHQPRPGSGEIGAEIPLIPLLKTLGVAFVEDVDAYNQKGVTAKVRAAMDHPGFAVVIARHPCVLQQARERKKRRPDLVIPKITIDQSACTGCNDCVSRFGCPSFKLDETGKVTVVKDLCIGDGSCVQTCDAGALVREGTVSKR